MLYNHKRFQDTEHPIDLNYFPIWNQSNEVNSISSSHDSLLLNSLIFFSYFYFNFQFKFDLYFQIKRSNTKIPEFDSKNKRVWLEVKDLDNKVYSQHYRPTVYNTDIEIISTKQYIPEYLKSNTTECTGKLNNSYLNFFV